MNNLQIIIAGTILSVVLIESLLLNVKLLKAQKKPKPMAPATRLGAEEKGFLDAKTGRREDIDPETRKVVPVR